MASAASALATALKPGDPMPNKRADEENVYAAFADLFDSGQYGLADTMLRGAGMMLSHQGAHVDVQRMLEFVFATAPAADKLPSRPAFLEKAKKVLNGGGPIPSEAVVRTALVKALR
jgi:hypothetical protein